MPSADKTPACTAWLWCWVLPPSPRGPSPGPQQATDSLINLWDEQPSEVLHYRLPRGWFALSFLINWTLLTNRILICTGNLPRLGSSCGSCLNNHQTVWDSLVEGCASLQHIWRVWQQTASMALVSSQGGETSLRCTGIEHRDFWRSFAPLVRFPLMPRGEGHGLCVWVQGEWGPTNCRTFSPGRGCWDLGQPVEGFTPYPLLSFDLKWGQCCWKQKAASERGKT